MPLILNNRNQNKINIDDSRKANPVVKPGVVPTYQQWLNGATMPSVPNAGTSMGTTVTGSNPTPDVSYSANIGTPSGSQAANGDIYYTDGIFSANGNSGTTTPPTTSTPEETEQPDTSVVLPEFVKPGVSGSDKPINVTDVGTNGSGVIPNPPSYIDMLQGNVNSGNSQPDTYDINEVFPDDVSTEVGNSGNSTSGGASSDDGSVSNGVVNTEFDKVKEFTDAINSGFVKSDKIWEEGRAYGLTDQEIEGIINSLGINTEDTEDPKTENGTGGEETGSDIYEQQRLEAERMAEAARQRAIVDANTSYQQNLATYGANAEALANMGLTSGGYSDYLKSNAYAQMRGEIQNANATADIAKRDAELKAEESRENARVYALNAYTGLMDGVNTGKYSSEQVSQLADEYGLSPEQKQSLIDAANAYTTKTETEKAEADAETALKVYATILDSVNKGFYTKEQAEQLADIYGLSADQKQSLIDAAQAYSDKVTAEEDKTEKENKAAEEEALKATSFKNYSAMKEDIKIDPDAYTDSEIEDFVTNKYLTREDADKLKAYIVVARDEYIKDLIDSGAFADVETLLDRWYADGKIDLPKYQKSYADAYKAYIKNADITEENIDAVIDDLKQAKSNGKISDADYIALLETAYDKHGVLNSHKQNMISPPKDVIDEIINTRS